MKLSGLALQHHRLFHFPQQLVMKKIGLNTANIEIVCGVDRRLIQHLWESLAIS